MCRCAVVRRFCRIGCFTRFCTDEDQPVNIYDISKRKVSRTFFQVAGAARKPHGIDLFYFDDATRAGAAVRGNMPLAEGLVARGELPPAGQLIDEGFA